MNWEHISHQLRTGNWIFLLVLGFLSFIAMSPEFTLGVILGGLLIIANFSLLERTLRRGFSPGGQITTNKIAVIAKYYFRLAILGIIIYMLITGGWVHPIGLTIGLSVVLFSIVHVGIRAAWKMSSGEAI